MHTLATTSNICAPTQYVVVGDQRYAYRRFSNGQGLPLLCLQHFTGTLDNWDPAVTAPLASGREVILFDNAGVGCSSGTVPQNRGGHGAPRAGVPGQPSVGQLPRTGIFARRYGRAVDGAGAALGLPEANPGWHSPSRGR